jgi:hypothetical protein
MELNKEQRVKLRDQYIDFVKEVKNIMGDKKLSSYYSIPLQNYLSEWGGLTFMIKDKGFACYSTDKTRNIYLWNERDDESENVGYLYSSLYREYKGGNITKESVILDILKQKEYIFKKIKEKLQEENNYINSILGI